MTTTALIDQEMSITTIVFVAILILCLFVFIPKIIESLKECRRLKKEHKETIEEFRRTQQEFYDSYSEE